MNFCKNHPNRQAIYQDEEWCLECYQDYFLDEDWTKPHFVVEEMREEECLFFASLQQS